MQPQRETLTDSLANILQILQLGYRSGTLEVEREAGNTIEEGYIVFVNGRVIDARFHQYRGIEALRALQTWGSCRFAFLDANDPGMMPPPRPSASPSPTRPLSSGSPAPMNGQWRTTPAPFPRRLPAGDAAIAHPEFAHLQRTQWRLLLLVNGQRHVSELARLLALGPAEVQSLLDTLVREGLIQQ
jgi:hypothetical protein